MTNPFMVQPVDWVGSIERGLEATERANQRRSLADLRNLTKTANFDTPTGRGQFMTGAMRIDPQIAAQYGQIFASMDENQRAQAKAMSDAVARAMITIKQLPPDQQPIAYQQAQQQFPEALTEPFDPFVIDKHINDARSIDELLKSQTDGPEVKFYTRADGSQAPLWVWKDGRMQPAVPGQIPSFGGQQQRGQIETEAIPDLPRGKRNNNPGNIVQSGIQWPGETPSSDPRFESFETPEQGIAATTSNLWAYGKKHGLNTVSGIIGRWSPASENGVENTNAYTQFVAGKLGVDPSQPLNMNDPATLQALTAAIIEFENGAQPYNQETLARGVQLALGDQAQATPVSVPQQLGGPPQPPNKKDFMVKDQISGSFVFDKNGYDAALKDYQAQADSYDRTAKTASDAAKAAAEAEKMTEGQAKDVSFAVRGRRANDQLAQYEQELLSGIQSVTGSVPLVGNYLTSSNYQMGQQAAAEFLAVILRKDTGAAVTPSEFATYGPIYLPQPGDAPEVVQAKKQARSIALNAIEQGAGPAGKRRIDEITKAYKEAAQTTASASAGADPAKAAEILSRWGIQ